MVSIAVPPKLRLSWLCQRAALQCHCILQSPHKYMYVCVFVFACLCTCMCIYLPKDHVHKPVCVVNVRECACTCNTWRCSMMSRLFMRLSRSPSLLTASCSSSLPPPHSAFVVDFPAAHCPPGGIGEGEGRAGQ